MAAGMGRWHDCRIRRDQGVALQVAGRRRKAWMSKCWRANYLGLRPFRPRWRQRSDVAVWADRVPGALALGPRLQCRGLSVTTLHSRCHCANDRLTVAVLSLMTQPAAQPPVRWRFAGRRQ